MTKIKHICASVFAGILAAALTVGIAEPQFSASAEEVSYNAIINGQGQDNWYYCYGNPEGDYYKLEKKENAANVWVVPGVQYAEITDYTDEGKSNMHPGDGPDGHQMIKMWQAPADGSVSYTMEMSKADNADGDGVGISVYKRTLSETGYSDPAAIVGARAVVKPNGKNSISGEDYTVKAGDLLMFAVDNNGTNASDSNSTVISLTYEQTGDAADLTSVGIGDKRVIDPEAGFSQEQGKNGYYYAYGYADRYVLMYWGRAWDRQMKWKGPEGYCHIDSVGMHPGNLFGAVKIWVADKDGTVKVQGSFGRDSASEGSDGSRMSIWHNEKALVEKTLAGTDNSQYSVDFTVEVKKGDTIRYFIDCGGNANNVQDGGQFRCEIYWADGSSVGGEEDLSEYLNDMTLEELMGVNIQDIPFEDPNAREDNGAGEENGCGAVVSGSLAVIAALSITGISLIRKGGRHEND